MTPVAMKITAARHRDGQRDREHCEGGHQSAARSRPRRPPASGQVGDDRVELAVGARPEQGLEALFQLLREKPPFSGGGAQPLGDPLTVRIRSSHCWAS